MQYYAKTISIEDQECRLQIWDTGGHANLSSSCEQGYLDILLPYLKQAHGLIVTYDVSDQASFDAVVQYFDLVQKHADRNITRLLVGTKKDRESERIVSFEQAQQKANVYSDRLYVETSAKNNCGVIEAFHLLASEIVTRIGGELRTPELDTVAEWIGEEEEAESKSRAQAEQLEIIQQARAMEAEVAAQRMDALQRKLHEAEQTVAQVTSEVHQLRQEFQETGVQLESLYHEQQNLMRQGHLAQEEL